MRWTVDTVLVRERGGGGEGGTYAVEDEGDGNAFPEGTAVPLVQRPGDQREESSDEESLEHASGCGRGRRGEDEPSRERRIVLRRIWTTLAISLVQSLTGSQTYRFGATRPQMTLA